MAPKAARERAQKKAAKQKKLLALLALPLLGALFFAFHTLTNLPGSNPVDAMPAAATTPAGEIPTAPTDVPVTPGVATPPIASLRSFVAFGRKDPFHDHGPHAGAGAASPNANGQEDGNGKGSPAKQPSVPLTGAVISIDGNKLALAVGAQFGHAPGLSGVRLFRLVKVTPKTALIAVVGTKQHFTLHRRRPLTLEQTGGWRYTLVLEPLGAAAPMTVQPTTTTTGP